MLPPSTSNMTTLQPHLTIVLLPQRSCTLDFETLTTGWLTGVLNLESTSCIHILRQTTSFLKLECDSWHTKKHILKWDTRTTAERMFAVRVKDDLLKHERIQKSKMWPIMDALYEAELRPSWSRAAVTWRYNDQWFTIHPGELSHDSPPSHIVKYANFLCGIEQSPPAHATSGDAPHTMAETHIKPSPKLPSVERNLIAALQQDVALAKRRAAEKTIQCCMLRRKLKLVEAELATSVLPCKTTNQSSHTEIQPMTQDTAAQTENHIPIDAKSCSHADWPCEHAKQLELVEHKAQKQVLDLQENARQQVLDLQANATNMLDALKKEYGDRISDLVKLNDVLVVRCKAQHAELVTLQQAIGK
jgi:hypothetical protein